MPNAVFGLFQKITVHIKANQDAYPHEAHGEMKEVPFPVRSPD